ncbi:MAG: TRAP transporter small permease, partial [Alphaproteobacteria bacterium]|nr:TRAP transporter small permease [Alphaproteobacteria bacterium]
MLKTLRRIVDITVQAGGWAFLGAACLVTYDVITRKLLNISIAGADEISGYVFAISTACAFSYALLSRANIRIDFIYNHLPPQMQRVLDVLSMAATAGFFAVICYYVYGLAADAIAYGSHSITPLQTPLAIPQVLWFIALCLSLLTSLVLLAAALKAMAQGKPELARELIGVQSLDEEVEIE